jgi:hypothetical protein
LTETDFADQPVVQLQQRIITMIATLSPKSAQKKNVSTRVKISAAKAMINVRQLVNTTTAAFRKPVDTRDFLYWNK